MRILFVRKENKNNEKFSIPRQHPPPIAKVPRRMNKVIILFSLCTKSILVAYIKYMHKITIINKLY